MLQNLSLREKSMILLLLPILLLAASLQFLWLPLQAKRAGLTAEISAYRQINARVIALQSLSGSGPVVPAAPTSPLSARVTQSAANAGLELRRLEPEADMLRVTVEEVTFANVLLWLSDLEVSQSVSVAGIEIDRRVEPGVVSARLLLRANP